MFIAFIQISINMYKKVYGFHVYFYIPVQVDYRVLSESVEPFLGTVG